MKFIKENGIAPVLMVFGAGFMACVLLVEVVWPRVFPKPTSEEVASAACKDEVALSQEEQELLRREDAVATLEAGVEIEGADAINDIPSVDADQEFHPNPAYFDDEYDENEWHDVSFNKDAVPIEMEDGPDAARILEKLTFVDPKYVWTSVKEDLSLKAELPYEKITFTAKELEGKKGQVIYSTEEGVYPKTTVSIPIVKSEGKTTRAFDDYGTLLVTTIDEDIFEADCSLRAEADLYLYDKKLLESGHHLTFVVLESGGIRVVGPTDGAVRFSYYSSEKWEKGKTTPTVFSKLGHGADISAFYWGGSHDLDETVRATATTIDLYSDLVDDIIDCAKDTNLSGRKDHSSFYHKNSQTFDLMGLLEPKKGVVVGKELIKYSDNVYAIQDSMHLNRYIITIQPKKIIVGVFATSIPHLGEDRLYNGLYFEDTTSNPEMVEIEGLDFSMSRATLESLIYLLEDSGTDWCDISANNLGLVE